MRSRPRLPFSQFAATQPHSHTATQPESMKTNKKYRNSAMRQFESPFFSRCHSDTASPSGIKYLAETGARSSKLAQLLVTAIAFRPVKPTVATWRGDADEQRRVAMIGQTATQLRRLADRIIASTLRHPHCHDPCEMARRMGKWTSDPRLDHTCKLNTPTGDTESRNPHRCSEHIRLARSR